MCTPTVAVRKDGKGFMVQKGDVWWEIDFNDGWWWATNNGNLGYGLTILEAVDAALAKLSKDKE